MQIEHRILIAASPERIFRIYEDVDHWHTWDPDTKSASLTSKLGVGARGSLTPTEGKTVPMLITAAKPGRSFTVESKLPLFRMLFEHELIPRGNDTEVIHRVTMAGLLSTVFGPMLTRQLNAGLPVTLANLRRLAEAQAGSTVLPPRHDDEFRV
ncbi:MAG: SRPBCC family protein [Steroidobacteraceae bacterium]